MWAGIFLCPRSHPQTTEGPETVNSEHMSSSNLSSNKAGHKQMQHHSLVHSQKSKIQRGNHIFPHLSCKAPAGRPKPQRTYSGKLGVMRLK